MEFMTEPIPAWALCYLINDDRSGLTEEEVAMIDSWYTANKVVTITISSEEDGESHPYFSHYPAFGLPTEVVDCTIMLM